MVNRLTNVGPEGMGMVFGLGRKDARSHDAELDGRRIPYRLASYEHDMEGRKFRSSNVAFSFWSASKYVLILSLMLWWLPMFGQMIAGYVGGRRAGGPWKGVAAAILPVVCLYAVMTGFETGILPSHVFGVAIAPAAIGAALSESVPMIAPYISFSSEYVGAFVQALAGSSPYGINMYVLTVAFAYVGGVLAEQSRRELEFNSGAVMSNTTVLVAEGGQQQMPAAHHGFLPALAAHIHWPGHNQQCAYPEALPAARARHRHRDAWDRAQNLVYVDGEQRRRLAPVAAQDYDEGGRAPVSGGALGRRLKRRDRHIGHRADSWTRPRRRARLNYSAKPRFTYEEYQLAEEERARAYRSERRHDPRVARVRAGDPKSCRKAKRMIEREWNRASQPVLVEGDDDGYVPTIPQHEPSSRRVRHAPSGDWDTI